MAYDVELADRLRALLADSPEVAADVTEQRMFGGLAFLVRGNMAVAASGQGGLMVRVGRAASEELVATTPAVPMEMRGRPMRGWLRLASADVADDADLAEWVSLGTAFALTLPAKA